MATFSDICTKDRLIRSNYYSDTYRAEFTLDGVKKLRDIQHISIPFEPEKAIAIKERLRFTESELDRFYEDFGKNLQHHMRMLKEIENKSNYAVDMSTVYPEKSSVIRKNGGNGSDVYFITEPMEPLIGNKSAFTENRTTLHTILDIGIRLLQTLKTYNENGICVGTLDLSSFYVVKSESGKSIVKNGSFFISAGMEKPEKITKDLYAFLPAGITDGINEINPDSDMYALCALLWSLLDGKHYSEAPDLLHAPKYAPAALTEALQEGMRNGTDARKSLGNALRQAKKTSQNGFVDIAPPEYILRVNSALEEYRKLHMDIYMEDEEESADHDKIEEIEEDNRIFLDYISKEKKITMGTGILVLAALILTVCFYSGKMLGEKGWRISRQDGIEDKPMPVYTPFAVKNEINVINYSPAPKPVSNPITSSDYPTLALDKEYEWFRSDYQATDFCAILFTNTFEIADEILESWNFYLNSDSVICYVYKRPQLKTDVLCSSEGGDKVLVICGNGSGKINVAMRQDELTEYMAYKFSYGVLNGLSVLNSTGSTPFCVPVNLPVSETEEEIETVKEEEITTEAIASPRQTETKENTTQSEYTYGYGGEYNHTGNHNGSSVPSVSTPNWDDSEEWGISVSNEWMNQEEGTDSGFDTSVTTYNLVLYATNSVIHVGESTEIYNAGNTGIFVTIESDNEQCISVSATPDLNGRYRVSGLSPGISEIAVTDQYGQTSEITIQCVPNA